MCHQDVYSRAQRSYDAPINGDISLDKLNKQITLFLTILHSFCGPNQRIQDAAREHLKRWRRVIGGEHALFLNTMGLLEWKGVLNKSYKSIRSIEPQVRVCKPICVCLVSSPTASAGFARRERTRCFIVAKSKNSRFFSESEPKTSTRIVVQPMVR